MSPVLVANNKAWLVEGGYNSSVIKQTQKDRELKVSQLTSTLSLLEVSAFEFLSLCLPFNILQDFLAGLPTKAAVLFAGENLI